MTRTKAPMPRKNKATRSHAEKKAHKQEKKAKKEGSKSTSDILSSILKGIDDIRHAVAEQTNVVGGLTALMTEQKPKRASKKSTACVAPIDKDTTRAEEYDAGCFFTCAEREKYDKEHPVGALGHGKSPWRNALVTPLREETTTATKNWEDEPIVVE